MHSWCYCITGIVRGRSQRQSQRAGARGQEPKAGARGVEDLGAGAPGGAD
jgi:hypothetical protein